MRLSLSALRGRPLPLWPTRVIEAGVLALAYYASARLGLSLAFANKNVTTVWPPTGIAVAALVLRGPWIWPGITVGAITANLGNGAPLATAAGISIGNTLAPLLAAYLLRRVKFHPSLDRLTDVGALVVLAGLASMLVSASLGTFSLALTGQLGHSSYWSAWTVWWVGDAMGVILFAPALLTLWSASVKQNPARKRKWEALLCAIATVAGSYFFLSSPLPIQYLVFPFVVWATLRFRQQGAAIAILLISAVSIPTTVAGYGLQSTLSLTTRLVGLDLFNATVGLSALILAAMVDERVRARVALEEATALLESRVHARTAELSQANQRLGREIAEHTDTEQELRQQTQRYESVLRALNDIGEGAVLVDMTTQHIIYANEAYCTITGFSLEELRSLPSYLDVIAPDMQKTMERSSHKITITNSKSAQGESVLLNKAGHRIPIDWASVRLQTGDKAQSVGIVRDATERKHAMEMLEAARDAAEAASNAKTQYISRMSHELRTPLTAILGYAELAQMEEQNAEVQRYLDEVLNAGEHLLTLVNEILDIARVEAGHEKLLIETVNVQDVAAQALRHMWAFAQEHGVVVRNDLAVMETCFAQTDRHRLLQILTNFLSNAIKYGGKSVELSAHLEDSDYVRISVADSGIGLSQSQQALLFQPFERAGAERTTVPGTGLGLALCKRLADAMDARMGVESQVGQGSTFWVEVLGADPPVVKTLADVEDQTTDITVVMSDADKVRILYVEDNPITIELVQKVCNLRPHVELMTTLQGSTAVKLAHEHCPDLILLDVHLPDMSGADVLRHLKRDVSTQDIPVVVLSADATPQQIDQLMDAGAQQYLLKPIHIRDLLDIIDRTATSRTDVTQSTN